MPTEDKGKTCHDCEVNDAERVDNIGDTKSNTGKKEEEVDEVSERAKDDEGLAVNELLKLHESDN